MLDIVIFLHIGWWNWPKCDDKLIWLVLYNYFFFAFFCYALLLDGQRGWTEIFRSVLFLSSSKIYVKRLSWSGKLGSDFFVFGTLFWSHPSIPSFSIYVYGIFPIWDWWIIMLFSVSELWGVKGIDFCDVGVYFFFG